MQFTLKNDDFPVVTIGKQATISQGTMEVKTDAVLYRLKYEIPFTFSWRQFLNDKAREHHINFHVSEDETTITINTHPDMIIWIGWWYKEWLNEK